MQVKGLQNASAPQNAAITSVRIPDFEKKYIL